MSNFGSLTNNFTIHLKEEKKKDYYNGTNLTYQSL